MTLLTVKGLHTHFVNRRLDGSQAVAKALNGVSFSLERGEVLGIVGESGAGKSLTALSILGLVRPPGRVVAGSACFDGKELIGLADPDLSQLRGRQVGMVVQNSKVSLDPLTRVGDQIARLAVAHRGLPWRVARIEAVRMLEAVGIPAAAERALAWPHELSGGMAQRVMIAMALINAPKLLIADEPTTGLDLTVQAQVLDLIAGEVRSRDLACLLITHDLGVVANYCQTVIVMFAGAVVEGGPVQTVFRRPAHPYTRTLLAAARGTVDHSNDIGRRTPPDLFALPEGCLYAERCPLVTNICRRPPPAVLQGAGQEATCHLAYRDEAKQTS
ncbi:ABC transporter ATP-binding protein [Pelagibius sp.]|uniref:ABC transporter ATP-binding protein n=1 Tax=Pelagibius sp. TaxID=1931238 RepID=UPI003BB17516